MTGYDIDCICKKLIGWKIPTLETYLKSKEKAFFEILHNYYINIRHFSDKDIKNHILVNYNNDKNTFDYYKLIDTEAFDRYLQWKNTKSTVALYYEQIKKSFNYIENFCINNNVSFENYIKKYAIKHTREKKLEYTVVSYCKLISKDKLNRVQKIFLKQYLSEYNSIEQRLCNPELIKYLSRLFQEMKTLLIEFQLWESCKTNQVTKV